VKREIWFEKTAWSYMPCHWKGVAVMMAIIFATVSAIVLAQKAMDGLGYANADWLPFIAFFFPGWLLLLRVARRHS
jgi:prolipoprotein diacylglyceryltransferase